MTLLNNKTLLKTGKLQSSLASRKTCSFKDRGTLTRLKMGFRMAHRKTIEARHKLVKNMFFQLLTLTTTLSRWWYQQLADSSENEHLMEHIPIIIAPTSWSWYLPSQDNNLVCYHKQPRSSTPGKNLNYFNLKYSRNSEKCSSVA